MTKLMETPDGPRMNKDPNHREDECMHRLRSGRLAWLPIPILLVALAVLWAANPEQAYESQLFR